MKEFLKKFKNKENEGFSLVELVVAVGVMLVLGVAVSYGYPGYKDWQNSSEVKIATGTAYESAVNVLDNPWEEMTVDDVIAYTESEYDNISLAYTGSSSQDLCIVGTFDGDLEEKYTMERGACNISDDNTPPIDEGETEPTPPVSRLLSSFEFMCDSTTTYSLPFRGLSTDASVYVEGSDGSTNLVEVTGDTQMTVPVTMGAGISYTVTVDGNFEGFDNTSSAQLMNCLTEVITLGEDLNIQHLSFEYAVNLVNVPDSIPSSVTSLNRAFYNLAKFNDPDVGSWDVSKVTTMQEMFRGASFNSDLNSWDVSSVIDMSSMFNNARSFNGDISNWDVSNVTGMRQMFYYAFKFNSDLSNWDVSNVTNMKNMFSNAFNFTSDLSNWDVSNVDNMYQMFNGASRFNSNLNNWDISKVTNTSDMFSGAQRFNGDISSWDVSNVTTMSGMFSNAFNFNGDISNWDVSNVTNMISTFRGASSFNGDISDWNVSKVTHMAQMFSNASSFNGDISSWDVSRVTDMKQMFTNASSFNGDISNWDVSNVRTMYQMFLNASSFNCDISSWDISSVTNMTDMFNAGYPLEYQPTK